MPRVIEIPGPDLSAKVTTESLLGEIAVDLYRLAAGGKPLIPLPFTVIAAPELAAAILRDDARFAKEYRFLELLARGRFTANGPEWRRRAALTQPAYRKAPDTLTEVAIERMYEASLRRRSEADEGLFECFVDGAVTVLSACLGLHDVLPWPADAVAEARKALAVALCVSLCGHAAESCATVRGTLAGFFGRIETAWEGRDDVRGVLGQLEAEGRGIEGFHPVGELIQNVMASSETTASALMWCVECLARFPAAREVVAGRGDAGGLDAFVDEVLRLFPPIPMVMRRCMEAVEGEGIRFAADDVLAVSFVGMHCDPNLWTAPLAFDPMRAEWKLPPVARPAYHPFSTGPRICGGARLALMEVRAGVRAFLRLFTTADFSAPLAIDYSLTSRPHRRIERFVHARRPRDTR